MTPKEIKKEDFKNIELQNIDFMHDTIRRLSDGLAKQFDNYIIEGLKRKGFEFETKTELEQFIKEHCRCEDYQPRKERIYYVDDKPFFLHCYKTEVTLPIIEDRKTTFSATYGTFAYL